MENLKKKKIQGDLSSIYEGKMYSTETADGKCDVWDDADNDGEVSVGDTFCYVECPD